jgi:formamidopyrimidine-DNA glycosylase
MPELPEIEAYLCALRERILGRVLLDTRVTSFSVLRTYEPAINDAAGRIVTGLSRLGKRIVIDLDGGLHIVIHLMVAGRLSWRPTGATVPKRVGLAAFDFEDGTLLLTEAGTKRRASIHIVDDAGLVELDPGGVEIAGLSLDEFAERLRAERHTLKRTLTDPAVFSGIGGAFADEILWAAGLSPTQITTNLEDDEVGRLHTATAETLRRWTAIRLDETSDGFPTRVTAFHPAMAVHGKFGDPCPKCGTPIQRIVHGKSETNYCPGCQTNGRILADRALSRLLKDDRPKRIGDLPGTA